MGTSCTVTVIGNGISSGNESDRSSSGDEDNQNKGIQIVKPTNSNRRRWRSAARSQPPDPLTSLPVQIADYYNINNCFTKPLLPPADVDEMENTNNHRRRRLRTRTKSFPISDGLIHYRKWIRQYRKFRITSFPTEPCSTTSHRHC
ncbi:hypothetical protein DPMN_009600 [Dreissena polymorpha]|uniref:Uncharacterized protein n=1 Tax=Dreissena polymorpha TaxID=45954 RepID=A0A9D4MYD4_DREPO|nr:hypothetical protein DPMN_009600 [Dreissena polymorpha]